MVSKDEEVLKNTTWYEKKKDSLKKKKWALFHKNKEEQWLKN